jgi:hypothetical protein
MHDADASNVSAKKQTVDLKRATNSLRIHSATYGQQHP